MKAIIYVGIGLFAVASVYGAADYYSTQKKGTLDKLYKEDEVSEAALPGIKPAVTVAVKDLESSPVEIQKSVAPLKPVKKAGAAHKRIRLDDFSRGRIIEPMPVEIATPNEINKEELAKKEEDKAPVNASPAMSEEIITKKEPERKLSLEMFSRAPLKRPVIKAKKSLKE